MITLEALNRMDHDRFVDTLKGIFEHSPWIPAAACPFRPFASIEALHARMFEIVLAAGKGDKRRLLESHPELGGKAAKEKLLTASSAAEQGRIGFDRLEADEAARVDALNDVYRGKFGFPFIIAVRGQRDRQAILRAMEARAQNSEAEEIETALREVAKIAWFRLSDLIQT
jgi:2-oxo-4-hydroxy-4-carboxy-5-ureidoimidazoline decarboxylase